MPNTINVPEYVLRRALKALEDEQGLYYGERIVAINLLKRELGEPVVHQHTKTTKPSRKSFLHKLYNLLT